MSRVFQGRLRVTSYKNPVAAAAAGFGPGTPYHAGDTQSETMVGWNPYYRPADAEGLPDRNKIVSRARDLTRNNGWAAGAVNKEVDAVIGSNFRPLSKPDWKALGLSEEWAGEFKSIVEARWRQYADDPRCFADLTRDQSISQLFGLGYRNYMLEGDALGVLHWRENRPTHTCLRVIDPDLLSNPMGHQDSEELRGGVELDADGVGTGYHFQQGHDGQTWASDTLYKWQRVSREQKWGRPLVLHFYDKHRDGQTRGVSRLAPIIEKLRMEDHYGKVELQAAVINAVLAAFIRSPMDPEAITEMLGEGDEGWSKYTADRAEYYSRKDDISLAGAKVTHLYPGEDIGTVDAARPAAQFADFEGAVLRNISSGLGISYEQLSADWSKTNYSSARAAMVEIWRGWTSRRHSFAQGFCQPFFMAWMEEEVDRGTIPLPDDAPDFHEHWASYARAKWIGPGKGFVDPVKEAQAAAMRVSLGLSTLEDEAAELTGSDLTENFAQIKREIEMLPEGVLHPAQESFAKLMGGEDIERTTATKKKEDGTDKPIASSTVPTMELDADKYGVAVRAGAITPQIEDEETFRTQFGLPAMSKDGMELWKTQNNVRQPVTLKAASEQPKEEEAAEEEAATEEEDQ